MFNALRYIKFLESAGFGREQAEAQVQLVMDAMNDEIATKSDITTLRSEMTDLRSELKQDMAQLRSDMADLRAELKADMSDLRVEIQKLEFKIFRSIAALIVPTLALMTWLAKIVH